MRKYHILKETFRQDFPQQCIWFDTETRMTIVDKDPFVDPDVTYWDKHTDVPVGPDVTVYHWLKFGYACYMRQHRNGEWSDETWLRFDTRQQWYDFVQDKTRSHSKLYLFCHNTSFDLPVLDVFNELPANGWKLRSAIIDAPPTILRFRRDTSTLIFIDTLNIWRMPLSELGKEIGLEKYEMPDDNDLTVSWESYGKRDVEIIRDACIRWFAFLEQSDMGSFSSTLAGQSMSLFRHRYMRQRILIDNDETNLALTRAGYYGGRNECFKIGKYTGDFHLLDVNSMYPSVMVDNPYPYRLIANTKHASIDDLSGWLKTRSLTARVLVHTNEPVYPIRNQGKLIFPVGHYECILSTPEIRYALSNKHITEVIEVSIFKQAYLFREMMLDLYKKRLDAKAAGRPVEAFMYRKLMNSFYGKWGQNGLKWNEERQITDLSARRWTEVDLESGRVLHYRQLAGLLQLKSTEGESRDSFPAIAGHVTAYARMVLWNIITEAGMEHCWYCDTDSVLVDSMGRRNLEHRITGGQLGALGVKGSYDSIDIRGCKDYSVGSKSRVKGARKSATWIDPNTIQQARWSSLRGLLATGNVARPVTSTVIKRFRRVYDKGEVSPSGDVTPHALGGVASPLPHAPAVTPGEVPSAAQPPAPNQSS